MSLDPFRRLRPVLAACTLALAALAPPARAQGNLGLAARSALDVWAVGDSGRYYRSLDGGASWLTGTLGARTLRAVSARGFHVVVVGDSGRIWTSADAGGSWAMATVPGAPALRGLDFADDSVGCAVGDNGTVVRLTAHGTAFTVVPSGTTTSLHGVRFTDEWDGWIVGAGGYAARTADGGAHWVPVGLGTSGALNAVDVAGLRVWIVGDDGLARRSVNGGLTFTPVDLKTRGRADVRVVRLAPADTVTLAGGGGFIRRSADDGATWSFLRHPLHGRVSGLAFAAGAAFASSDRHRVVIHSTDGGESWAMPAGANLTRSWTQKLNFGANVLAVRGNTLQLNPVYKTEVYALLGFNAGGVKLYESRDEGESWTQIGNTLDGVYKANAFLISPKDTTLMAAAVADPGKVVRSTNNATSWTDRLPRGWGEYGVPLEMHPDRPDTLFFGGDTTGLWRSTDFGDTWSLFSATVFRQPCDIQVTPDSGSLVLVADGVTGNGNGEVWRSLDGGVNFTRQYQGTGMASEVPELAVSRLRNGTTFATNWSSGGVVRSTDYGLTWPQVSLAQPAWGVDIAGDDPNVVIFGLYNGGQSYLSLDGGDNFTAIPLSGANYSLLARDRGLVLAQQSSGIWKLGFAYGFNPVSGQSVALTSPVGGEVWNPGEQRPVTWNPTNIAIARIEYRKAPGQPWQFVADSDGPRGRYDWIVPFDPGTLAKIRVRDAWDGTPGDTSAAAFTITDGVGVPPEVSRSFALEPNQPNPFTRGTTLRYRIGTRSSVRLEVFDVRGERVATLVNAWQEPGSYSARFASGAPGVRPGTLAAGVYFARLTTGGFQATRKMLLFR